MTAYEALISNDLHNELNSLRDDLGKENTRLQIGIMPTAIEPPRILFIGKAPGNIPSTEILSERSKIFSDSMEWNMKEEKKPTSFWRWCRHFVNAISDTSGYKQNQIFPGWSNLVKIGGIGSKAPKGHFLKKQIGLSRSIIEYELSHARADAVVFLTGNDRDYIGEIQNYVAGETSTWTLDNEKEWICQKIDARFGLLFWIDHPDYKSNDMRNYVSEFIAAGVVRRWKERTRQT
jgi:hypothetical protein